MVAACFSVAVHHNNFILVCSTFYLHDVFSFYLGTIFFNHGAGEFALLAIVIKNTKKGFARPGRYTISSAILLLERFR